MKPPTTQPIYVNAQAVTTFTLADPAKPGDRCAIVFPSTRNVAQGTYLGLDPDPPLGREGSHLFDLDGFNPAFAVRLDDIDFFWVKLESDVIAGPFPPPPPSTFLP